MKKNIKLLTSAASTMLVLTTLGSPMANASVIVNNATATQKPATTPVSGSVNVNLSLNATADVTTVADAIKSIKVDVTGANLANKNYKLEIVKAGTSTALSDSTKLQANQAYQIVVENLQLNGLTTGNHYALSGGSVNGTTTQTAEQLNAANGVTFTSDSFFVFNTNLTGTPVVTEGNHIVTSGSVDLGNNLTVASLAKAITNKYSVKIPTGSAKALDWSESAVENSVRAGLKNANVTVANDGSFVTPATSFNLTLTGYASNGKSVTFPVTVNVSNTTTSATNDVPVFTTTNTNYKKDNSKVNTWNLTLPLNSGYTTDTIANAFTAKINNNSDLTTNISVESSNFSSNIAGNYSVVLKATNPEGKTSRATINVKVGDPAEVKTVQAGSETAHVVTIDGNNITTTDTILENGSSVATFGKVTVNGVSYTRLNNSNSNQFVATKYVDGSIKEEKTSEKTIMHVAIVYDKNGKKTDEKKIGAYNKVTVYGDIVTINGSKYYKLGPNRFVKVGNIDGTNRTLKHNAYIYNNKLKRVDKNTTLRKGTKQVTYGSSFTFKGKRVYRIGENRYVKVANFE